MFLENFNAALTENARKRHVMEPSLGQVDYWSSISNVRSR
jgi:hypothetical protein